MNQHQYLLKLKGKLLFRLPAVSQREVLNEAEEFIWEGNAREPGFAEYKAGTLTEYAKKYWKTEKSPAAGIHMFSYNCCFMRRSFYRYVSERYFFLCVFVCICSRNGDILCFFALDRIRSGLFLEQQLPIQQKKFLCGTAEFFHNCSSGADVCRLYHTANMHSGYIYMESASLLQHMGSFLCTGCSGTDPAYAGQMAVIFFTDSDDWNYDQPGRV